MAGIAAASTMCSRRFLPRCLPFASLSRSLRPSASAILSQRLYSGSSIWSGEEEQAVLRRASRLTLSSWFKLPEQGMADYELLSRASCFLVHATPSQGSRLLLLGAAHVSFPFRFPQYYPREQYAWLDMVEEHHTRHLLELRDDSTGDVLESHTLQSMASHPTRDLVAGQMEDEDAFLSSYADLYGKEDPALLLSSEAPDNLTEKDVFVVGCAVDEAGMEGEQTVSQNTAGVVRVVTHNHIFATTDSPLSMGICGGPVLARDQLIEGEESQSAVVGMLEGVVTSIRNADNDAGRDVLKTLEGNAAIIPGPVLADFRESYLPE